MEKEISQEKVLKMWDDFEKAEFCEDDYDMRLKKPFYHFPIGTTHMEIADWFDSHYVGGLMNLLEK